MDCGFDIGGYIPVSSDCLIFILVAALCSLIFVFFVFFMAHYSSSKRVDEWARAKGISHEEAENQISRCMDA